MFKQHCVKIVTEKSFLFLVVQISVLLSVFVFLHLPDHPHLSSISPNTDYILHRSSLNSLPDFFAPVSVMIYFLFTRPLLHHESAFLSAASLHHHVLKIKPLFFFFFKPITRVSTPGPAFNQHHRAHSKYEDRSRTFPQMSSSSKWN